jgi:flagellar basal body-associated protein FliL
MADADETKEQEPKQEQEQKEQQEAKAESGEKKPSGGRLRWIIMTVVVIVCAGAGFGLGRMFGPSGTNENTQTIEDGPAVSGDRKAGNPGLNGDESQGTWFYDLEPVVANLDAPGVTRYVRLTLTLEISSKFSKEKGIPFLEEKKPILTNWLTIYLAGLSLEDIRGDRNLKSIQSQLLDAFNEKLFPDSKPQIKRLLFKEFAVQ